MTAASHWRQALAHRVAQHYALSSGVDALFLGGSTALGQADRYSDIELCVLWTVPPTDQERARVITQLGGDLHRLYPYNEDETIWEDLFFFVLGGRSTTSSKTSNCRSKLSKRQSAINSS